MYSMRCQVVIQICSCMYLSPRPCQYYSFQHGRSIIAAFHREFSSGGYVSQKHMRRIGIGSIRQNLNDRFRNADVIKSEY